MSASKIIVSGASTIKDIAWPTWLTFTKNVYGFTDTDIVDQSAYGLGNEAIILKAVNAAMKEQNPFLIIQLTQIDKWDWYVENLSLIDILDKEKHPIQKLNITDNFGFWSTGSHFPLFKESFKEKYFGIHYFAFKTLLMLSWFQYMCRIHDWRHLILFDSPILSVTEEQLNLGLLHKEECFLTRLIDNPICAVVNKSVDLQKIYLPGLMGFACINEVPWFSKRYKNHPGSYAHYIFFKNIIMPMLPWTLKTDVDYFESEALVFQRILNQT
jgi:hypothetical protein